MPDSTPDYLSGIDVSHYQGSVDWSAVARSGAHFAFVKATEGTNVVDPEFQNNWSGSKANGILRGAYHFMRPEQDAGQQAQHYLSTVSIDSDALPPVLDVEVSDGVAPAKLQAGMSTWLETVEKAVGTKPIIYTDPSFWQQNVTEDFSAYPIWLADYGPRANVPGDWKNWTFWQYTQSGKIDGVDGAVDLNRYAFSEAQLNAMLPSKGRPRIFPKIDRA